MICLQGLTFPVGELFLEDVLEKTQYCIKPEPDSFQGGSRRRARQLDSKRDPLTELFEACLSVPSYHFPPSLQHHLFIYYLCLFLGYFHCNISRGLQLYCRHCSKKIYTLKLKTFAITSTLWSMEMLGRSCLNYPKCEIFYNGSKILPKLYPGSWNVSIVPNIQKYCLHWIWFGHAVLQCRWINTSNISGFSLI